MQELLSRGKRTWMNLVWGTLTIYLCLEAGANKMDRSNSTHSHFGAVKSSIGSGDNALSAGGSSGGSAVAVATGQCHAYVETQNLCANRGLTESLQSTWDGYGRICSPSGCLYGDGRFQTIVRSDITMGGRRVRQLPRYSRGHGVAYLHCPRRLQYDPLYTSLHEIYN